MADSTSQIEHSFMVLWRLLLPNKPCPIPALSGPELNICRYLSASVKTNGSSALHGTKVGYSACIATKNSKANLGRFRNFSGGPRRNYTIRAWQGTPNMILPDPCVPVHIRGITMSHDEDEFMALPNEILDHVKEGGFRYHAYNHGTYAFPNDDNEQTCEAERYMMSLILCDHQLHLAPVGHKLQQSDTHVLDLGTGTGLWACDMGDKYPSAGITGIDISPIQPDMVPPNTEFLVGDFEKEWDLNIDNDAYDYIHVRHTIFNIRDQKAFVDNIFRALKPGGYVEFHGIDHNPLSDDGSVSPKISYGVRDAVAAISAGLRQYNGADFDAITMVEGLMRDTGFESITNVVQKLPFGGWPKDRKMWRCGMHARSSFLRGMKGMLARPLGPSGLGWTLEQIEVFLASVRRDIKDESFHAWFPYHITYGRKPS